MAIPTIVAVAAGEDCHGYKYQYDNCNDFQQSIFHTHILRPMFAGRDEVTGAIAPSTSKAHIVSTCRR